MRIWFLSKTAMLPPLLLPRSFDLNYVGDRLLCLLWHNMHLFSNPSVAVGTRYIPSYNMSVARQYSICTTEAILDDCFTELFFYGLPYFTFGCIIF